METLIRREARNSGPHAAAKLTADNQLKVNLIRDQLSLILFLSQSVTLSNVIHLYNDLNRYYNVKLCKVAIGRLGYDNSASVTAVPRRP